MGAESNLEALSERMPSDRVVVAKLSRWLSMAERVLDSQVQEVRGLRLQCHRFARGLPGPVAQASMLSREVPLLGYRAPGEDSGGFEEVHTRSDLRASSAQCADTAQFKLEEVEAETRRQWLRVLDEKLQPLLKSQRRGQAGYCALQKRRESVEKALIGLGSGLQAAGIARGTSSDGRGAFAALSLVFILEECTALASSVDAEPGVGTSESAQKSADCARRFWELTRAARDLAGDQNSGLQAIDGQLGVVENTVVGLSNLVLRGTHLQASLRELEQLERSKFGYKLLDKFVSERKLLAMSSAYAIFSITGMVFLSGLFWDYREGLLLHTSVEDFVLAGFRLGFWAIAGGTAVLLVVVVSRRWVRAAGPTTLGQPSRFRTRMLRIANPIVLLPALLLVSLGAAWGLGYGQLHLLQSEDARVGALSRGMRWIYGDPRSSTIRLADKTIHSGIIMSRPNSDFVLIKPRDRSYLTVPRREIRCIATREDDCARVPSIGQPATLTSADRAFEQLTTR